MAKQWTELEKLTIKKGSRKSNTTSVHPRTGTVAVITIYCPYGEDAWLCVSANGTDFFPFHHKGQAVKLEGASACDVPLPACNLMRIETLGDAEEDRLFQVLALLEVD